MAGEEEDEIAPDELEDGAVVRALPPNLPALKAPPARIRGSKKDLLAYYLAEVRRYPLLTREEETEWALKFVETGEKPVPTEGKDFFDTGVALVTDKPVDGVESISVSEGMDLCWG